MYEKLTLRLTADGLPRSATQHNGVNVNNISYEVKITRMPQEKSLTGVSASGIVAISEKFIKEVFP